MTYLINVDQLCQHLASIMYPAFHRPQRQAPRPGYLVQGVTLGELHEGVYTHRTPTESVDEVYHIMDYGALICGHTTVTLPVSKSLSAHILQSLFRVHPQVAHDGPAPWQQRTAHVIRVPCLQCPRHRVGGKVMGTFPVVGVVTPLGDSDEREVCLHDAFLKVHGS